MLCAWVLGSVVDPDSDPSLFCTDPDLDPDPDPPVNKQKKLEKPGFLFFCDCFLNFYQ
jgi:hypothetical protein